VGASGVEPELQKAVVQIGSRCSGTLVAADGVLTSAHCLTVSIDEIFVNGTAFRVTKCERDGAYRPGLPAHDLGYCRLATASAGAIAIDDGPPPAIGTPVELAGYGVSGAPGRDCPALKTVGASVVGVHPERIEVRAATATACRGESGGPMLVDHAGALRVAGVIQGAEGTVCASATEVVPVSGERDWLRAQIVGPSNVASRWWGRHAAPLLLGWLLLDAAIVAFIWWRRARR